MKKYINKIIITLLICISITIVRSYSFTNTPTYLDSVKAVDYSLIGLEEIKKDIIEGKKVKKNIILIIRII